jgi:hypothetical protein
MRANSISNQRGLITLDFVFALVLVFAFTAVLFTISLTLSVVEITQYITFASARNYFAGHNTKDAQEKLAKAKFQQLSNSSALKPLFNNGWFELKNFEVGPGTTYQNLEANPERFTFFGTAVYLRAPVLNFRVPFFGRTAADEDSAFEAQITSWLAREPATDECREFNESRMRLIKQIGGNAYNAPQISENAYAVMTDNGC